MSTITFSSLGLDNWIANKLCDKIGYKRPSKIQKMAIPDILKGHNVIVNAETGSGKTATFSFPILQKLAQDPYGIFALILTPNRELAFQISEQLQIYGQSINLRISTIVGGMDIIKQRQQLDEIPHIVCGTPGRVLDQLENSLALKEYIQNINFLVLDEVDRLIDQSILQDLLDILDFLPKERQIILTSATIQKEQIPLKLMEKISPNSQEFKYFEINNQVKTVQTLKQHYVFIPEDVKEFYFVHLLKKFDGLPTIVFISSCKKVHMMYLLLKQLGMEVTCLHSYLKQIQRTSNLKKFKNSRVKILLATDVASRGLDIPTVDLVINYDIPRDYTDYVHRVGRTARKGKRGLAISMVTQYDIKLIQSIEENIGLKLDNYELNEKEVLDEMSKIIKAKKIVKIKMSENGTVETFDNLEKMKTKQKQKFQVKRQKNQQKSDEIQEQEKIE